MDDNTCNKRREGKRCGYPLVEHPNPNLIKKIKLCSNPECLNYFICKCGVLVGHHVEHSIVNK